MTPDFERNRLRLQIEPGVLVLTQAGTGDELRIIRRYLRERSLRVRQIDGERGLLRVEQGKDGKDGLVTLAPALLEDRTDPAPAKRLR